jgi:hypothetical protein
MMRRPADPLRRGAVLDPPTPTGRFCEGISRTSVACDACKAIETDRVRSKRATRGPERIVSVTDQGGHASRSKVTGEIGAPTPPLNGMMAGPCGFG